MPAEPVSAHGRTATTASRGARALTAKWAPLLPFSVWILLFLGLPVGAVAVAAFEKPGGGLTLANLRTATTGAYLLGFENSLKMAAGTSITAGVAGAFVAYALHTSKRALVRRALVTASGVLANFGGVPLAFLFIASVGSATALVTSWLRDVGIDLYAHGITLYSLWGVALVYMYWLIPLMVLVTLPAFEGLKRTWREASEGLGGSTWQFWRYVGVPVLMPALLGSVLLLFGSALSAYATANALTAGTLALTPLQIGSFLDGNVMAGQQNVGYALAVGLVLLVVLAMIGYTALQRRATRWLR